MTTGSRVRTPRPPSGRLENEPTVRRRPSASPVAYPGRLLLVLLGLAGCAAPVRTPQLDDSTPAEWRHAPADDLPAASLESWWTAFSDPELDALVGRALDANLSIREAAARLRAARSLAPAAERRFRPTVDFRTGSDTNPGTRSGYFEAGFDSVWELGWFGRADAEKELAGAGVAASEADVRAARVSVVAEVVRSFVSMRAAAARARYRGAAVDHACEALHFVELRRDRRLASDEDVEQARARVAEDEARLTEPRQDVVASRQRLAVLLGDAEPDEAIVAEGDQPRLEPVRVTSAPADLLRTRPEIRRAEAAVLRAAGELGVAHADLYPRVALGGAITLEAGVTGPDAGTTSLVPSVGPLIDIPLFDWGVRRAAVDAKDAGLEAAELAYRQAVLEGVAEVEVALSALDGAYARSRATGKATAAYERLLAATDARRRHGLADGLERAQAALALDEARAEDAAAERDHAVAYVALCKALGGASVPETAP